MTAFESGRSYRSFWFRVFGYGAHLWDAREYKPLFSERNGYRRVYRIGWLKIEFLTKVRP